MACKLRITNALTTRLKFHSAAHLACRDYKSLFYGSAWLRIRTVGQWAKLYAHTRTVNCTMALPEPAQPNVLHVLSQKKSRRKPFLSQQKKKKNKYPNCIQMYRTMKWYTECVDYAPRLVQTRCETIPVLGSHDKWCQSEPELAPAAAPGPTKCGLSCK